MKDQIMREAGRKLRGMFDYILPDLQPGIFVSELEAKAEDYLKTHEAKSALKMLGFPSSISIARNKEVIQGFPEQDARLEAGDLVSLDSTLYYKGFFVDKAISIVLEPKHYIKNYLVSAVKACLQTALNNIRPGVTTGQIGSMIEAQATMLKVKIAREFSGHSIGESHHMKPLIPNYNDMSDNIIREGMYLAIEPIVFYDLYSLRFSGHTVYSDELSAHAEETVVVTKNGVEVIT